MGSGGGERRFVQSEKTLPEPWRGRGGGAVGRGAPGSCLHPKTGLSASLSHSDLEQGTGLQKTCSGGAGLAGGLQGGEQDINVSPLLTWAGIGGGGGFGLHHVQPQLGGGCGGAR